MSFPVSGESKYLATIARQLARISNSVRAVYVEQKDGVWSWALAHAGGPYPLLRTAASLRGVDHRRAFIGYFGFDDHSVAGDPDHEAPEVAFILKLDEVRDGDQAAIRREIRRRAAEKVAAKTGRIDPNENPDDFEVPPPDYELLTYQELLAEARKKKGKRASREEE